MVCGRLIEIAAPQDGDYTAPLDAIFSPDLAGLIPAMPDFWQPFARRHFLVSGETSDTAATPRMLQVPGATPPRLKESVPPASSDQQRALKYSGIVRVAFNVDTQGMPVLITIAHPAGLGLDENAVEAVRHYRFFPAMKDGHPVVVTMVVDVNWSFF